MEEVMTSRMVAVVLACLTLGAMGEVDRSYKEKALEGYTRTGTREACVPLSNIKSTKILDDSSILFYMNNGTAYLNELPDRCGPLNRYRSITYTTSLSKLCNTDVIDVIDAGSPVPKLGTCGLGQFELLAESKRAGQGQ
jgi:Family of unknown function (DUF6491)